MPDEMPAVNVVPNAKVLLRDLPDCKGVIGPATASYRTPADMGCGRKAHYQIDGVNYCPQHARSAALYWLLDQQTVPCERSLEATQ